MATGRNTGYSAGVSQYIQRLASKASVIFAIFIGFNACTMGVVHWQWIVALLALYSIYNFVLLRRGAIPSADELVTNLGILAVLGYLRVEYSACLYHLLLLRMTLRAGGKRASRVAIFIGLAFLISNVIVSGAVTNVMTMQMLFNLVVMAVMTYAVISVNVLFAKRSQDDRQVLALIEQNAHNYRMALTDSLTGLYNHRAYKEKIESVGQYVLLIIDIDHFKKLNDTYGHLVGDKVLVTISNIIKCGIRSGDMAFRYGGEEFVVVLPGATLQVGYKIAERLRQKVEEWSLDQGGAGSTPITVSIGIAMKRSAMSSQGVFEQADSALYSAKQSGRNNVKSIVELAGGVAAKCGV
ncbi:MAG: diguanylate cyclase domain protein [Firmicutes bacterium]|nr:diguanylate cyclase domain protein [Bacillota bacterium]